MSRKLVEQSRASLGLHNLTVPQILALARDGRSSTLWSDRSIQKVFNCPDPKSIWIMLSQLNAARTNFVKIEKIRLRTAKPKQTLMIESMDCLDGSNFAKKKGNHKLVLVDEYGHSITTDLYEHQCSFLIEALGKTLVQNVERTTYILGNVEFAFETIQDTSRCNESTTVTLSAHDFHDQIGRDKLEKQIQYYADFLGISEIQRTSEPQASLSSYDEDADFLDALRKLGE